MIYFMYNSNGNQLGHMEITMRKIKLVKRTGAVFVAASLGMAVLCSGCGNKEKNEQETTKKVVETTSVKELTPPTEETTTVSETTENVETTVAKTEEATTVAKSMPSMSKLYDEIVKAAGINGMYQLFEEDMLDYYGIDVATDCNDFVFYQSEISPGIDTVALFQCKNKAGAENVAAGLQVVLDSLRDSTLDYAPEEYDKAVKAEVKTKGNFVYLIICEKLSAAEDIINQY